MKDITLLDSIDSLNDKEWDNLIDRSPNGNCFLRSAWLRCVEEGMGLSALHVVCHSEGKLEAVFPNFIEKSNSSFNISSLPMGYGGLAAPNMDTECLPSIIDKLQEICLKKGVSHKICMYTDKSVGYWCILRDNDYSPHYACSFRNDLSKGLDYNFRLLDDANKRLLRHHYDNFNFETSQISEDNLNDFYISYSRSSIESGERPIKMSFFESLLDNCSENVVINTVSNKDGYVGGKLRILDNSKNIIHGLLVGLEKKYESDHLNFLTDWHTMEWGIRNRYGIIDWGHTADDLRNERFKRHYGIGGTVVPTITWEKSYGHLNPLICLYNKIKSKAI